MGDIHADDLRVYPFSTYDQIVHFGANNIDSTFDEGVYFIQITDGFSTWYSEDITFRTFDPDDLSASCMITKFTYWNTCDIGGIFYRTTGQGDQQYKNVFYLDTSIGVYEYEYEEEGEEDAQKVFYPDFQKLEKVYNIQGVFPPFMVDALALMPLHLNKLGKIEVYTYLGYTGTVTKMTVEPEWQGSFGAFAKVDIDFSTAFATSSNCCDILEQVSDACIATQYEAKDTLAQNGALYLAGQYMKAGEVSPQDFEVGDYVLSYPPTIAGNLDVEKWNGTSFDVIQQSSWGGEDATEIHALESGGSLTSIYKFNAGPSLGWISTPQIYIINDAGPNTFHMRAKCWDSCTVKIYSTLANNTEILTHTITGAQFTAGLDLMFAVGATQFRADFEGATCQLAQIGNAPIATIPLRGIGFMQINNYTSNPFKVSTS